MATDEVNRDLLKLVRTVLWDYRREAELAVLGAGLSPSAGLVLVEIARSGDGVRQGSVARQLALAEPSLVRPVDQLCVAGLVERRVDPCDRRAKTLHTTSEGKIRAAQIEDSLFELRHDVLGEIQDAQIRQAISVLERVGELTRRRRSARQSD